MMVKLHTRTRTHSNDSEHPFSSTRSGTPFLSSVSRKSRTNGCTAAISAPRGNRMNCVRWNLLRGLRRKKKKQKKKLRGEKKRLPTKPTKISSFNGNQIKFYRNSILSTEFPSFLESRFLLSTYFYFEFYFTFF